MKIKNQSRWIGLLLFGGGGESRTPVHQHYICNSTCLDLPFALIFRESVIGFLKTSL